MSAPLLELDRISRIYPTGDVPFRALDAISLKIHAGEMVAIIGPSGSGKSTLMNILGCLDTPSAGDYHVAGQATAALEPDALARLRRNHFGFIFQRYHLLPHLDAAHNVQIPAIYAGTSTAVRHARSHELLTRLGLQDRLRHRPSQLSGGQQQRVSVARALMNGGQVILADEPTGALDSKSGEEMMALLKELHHNGHAIVLVTHDSKVAAHADRIIEMCDGKIVADSGQRAVETDKQQPSAINTQESHTWRALAGRTLEALRMAGFAMASHRLRTLLTMLGIIIGIAAVVSVVALGQGAQKKIISDINSMGTNIISIMPGKGWGDSRASAIETLMPADFEALRQEDYIDSASPSLSTSVLLRYRNLTVSASITGVSQDYFRVRGYEMAQGRIFTDTEVRQLAQAVVIDANTADTLFPGDISPVGKVLLLNSLPCRIIGVTAEKDTPFGIRDSLNAWLPYTSAMSRLIGQRYFNSITVRVVDGYDNDTAENNLTQLLIRRHGSKDFYTSSSDTILKTINKATSTMTLLIAAIAVISLIVGGIGVMNIMLVSVSERTHEIGIRMAVGARQSDIMQQFLIEAVLVCLMGGALGIGLSYLVSLVFPLFVTSITMQFTSWSIISAVSCSTLIGVSFGFLPARNAARLNPVEALSRD
ncbi:MacB family efflux pump subunit [uncultured Desulfuromonas sp.]|uniref:MacB family efflux pump subunit n=1 Tax=uncultured Desulfuromonas sp. TaxID=181013 RepID=UPI002AAB6DA8|nr:MacB family efflux pump subunit [uncultured Desulfuromonas sp.]